MKKILLYTLVVLWIIAVPHTASSHPYEEPSQSIDISNEE